MFASDSSRNPRNRRFGRFAVLAVACAAVSSCVTTRIGVELPEISNWQERQAVLQALRDWEFRGRIAVKAGDEGFNGKFNWAQSGDSFEASVGGPLGIGTVRIEGDDTAIVLTDKDGVETALIDPERELYERYGWTIPVTSLRYWALGVPDPDRESTTEIDADGRLASLEQGNWSVTISRYRESAGQAMPRTLTAMNPETRVRMVIDTWLFYQ